MQSYATVARSKQTLKGKVADDAKLDTLDLQDLTNETQCSRSRAQACSSGCPCFGPP